VNFVVIFHAINVATRKEISIKIKVKNLRKKLLECAAKFVIESFCKDKLRINSLYQEEVDLLRLKRNSSKNKNNNYRL
jgi:hypothetical protein